MCCLFFILFSSITPEWNMFFKLSLFNNVHGVLFMFRWQSLCTLAALSTHIASLHFVRLSMFDHFFFRCYSLFVCLNIQQFYFYVFENWRRIDVKHQQPKLTQETITNHFFGGYETVINVSKMCQSYFSLCFPFRMLSTNFDDYVVFVVFLFMRPAAICLTSERGTFEQ